MHETLNNAGYVYGRHSSQKQDDGDSERRQTEELATNAAKKHKILIKKIFYDSAKSGFHGDNLKPDSQLNQMLSILRRGDTVLVEDTDRLTRKGNYILLPLLHKITEEIGAKVILTRTDHIITADNFQDLHPTLNGYLDNVESKRKKGRNREVWLGTLELIRQGKTPPLGLLPFWLSNVEIDKVNYYKEDPALIAIVERIFNLYLAGNGCVTIARILNREGGPMPRRSRKWYGSTVKSVLTSKAVLGLCDLVEPPVKLYRQIIKDDAWLNAQKLLALKAGIVRPRIRRVGVLSGLLKCSVCGNNMVIRTCGKRIDKDIKIERPNYESRWKLRYYYRCGEDILGKRCNSIGIRKDLLMGSLRTVLSWGPELVEFVNMKNDVSMDRLNSLNASLAENKKKISHLVSIIENAEADTNALVKRLHALEIESEHLQTDIILENAHIASHKPASIAIADYQTRLVDKWNDPKCQADLRNCLHSMIDKIVVYREDKRYEMFLKNANEPIDVKLDNDGFTIPNPPIKRHDENGGLVLAKFPYTT